jgi:protein-disulfide isomerase
MNTTVSNVELAVPVSPERDHIRGPASARVTLLEYGDYECPYCSAAHVIVNQVQTELQSQMRFAFRHFPLIAVHPHAQTAAESAEAAATQGRFWRMHDELFVSERPLSSSTVIAAAARIGLNMSAFQDELGRHLHARRVRDDFMSGVRSGVKGTPTFYINSVRYDGAWNFSSLSAALIRATVLPVEARVRHMSITS